MQPSCPLRALLGCDSLSDLPVFNNLDGLEEEPDVFQDAPQGRPQRGGALLTTSRQGACRHVTSMVDADRGRPAQASPWSPGSGESGRCLHCAATTSHRPLEGGHCARPPPEEGRSPPLRTGQLQSHVDPPGFLLCHLFTSGWPRGVFIYFMLWAVIQYDSVLLLNRLWRWPSGVPRLALLSHPDTPICGGCCVLFLSTSLPRAQDAPGSSRHFLFLSESQCSSREPSPFRWKWCKRPRSGCRRLTTAGESWPLSAGWGPQDHS